jgi:hypothetical protein
VLIDNAQGKTEELYQTTMRFIQESRAPEVKIEEVKVRPSWLAGLFGRERKYLMVRNEGLKDYRMYVGARDYGNNLDVSWYLTCEPGFLKKTFSRILTEGATDKAFSFDLDIFQQQDLTAYVTCVHHCLLKAVEAIMLGLGQDFSKIERKSRGFLGVS